MSEHISYSQINMYYKCGEQYRRRYLCGDIIPPGLALIKGKSVHKGIEINNVQKIKSHEDLPKNDIVEQTVTAYEKESQQEISLKPDESIGTGKDGVVTLAELYADKVAPTIQPVAAEEKSVIEMFGAKPVVVVIDCIDDKGIIHDYKTTGKSKPQSEADTSLQLSMYAMAYHDKTGNMPTALQLDTLIEKKKPEYKPLTTTRDKSVYKRTAQIIAAVSNGIERGVFLPAQPGAWVCSPTWCGYYATCKYVN
jgi:hypothetical protein